MSKLKQGKDSDDSLIQEAIRLLQRHGIKLVAFDMDLTAVAQHSRGKLKRSELHDYLKHTTSDFVKLVPELHKAGLFLAIATHSDEAEFLLAGKEAVIQRESHILGEELARALLAHCFHPNVQDAFHVVAYNPRARKDGHLDENKIKRRHMNDLVRHFNVLPREILFLDDDSTNISDCNETCQVKAVQVNPEHGFQLSDLLEFEF
jgi:hypothetical protein